MKPSLPKLFTAGILLANGVLVAWKVSPPGAAALLFVFFSSCSLVFVVSALRRK